MDCSDCRPAGRLRESLGTRPSSVIRIGSMRGRPEPTDFWGKFRDEKRGGPTWHPLVAHSTDVACVMEGLLAQPTFRRRLARAGGLEDLDEVQVARLCWLAF